MFLFCQRQPRDRVIIIQNKLQHLDTAACLYRFLFSSLSVLARAMHVNINSSDIDETIFRNTFWFGYSLIKFFLFAVQQIIKTIDLNVNSLSVRDKHKHRRKL